MLGEFATAGCLVARCKIGHRFVQVALIQQQLVGILQRHIGPDLAQRFERGGDVNLRLALEESFVARLAEQPAVSTTALANVL